MSPLRRTAWLTEQITRLPPTQRTARALRITPNPRTTQTERTARITRVTARASRKPALRCPYRAQPKAPVRLRPAPEAPAPANKRKREPPRFPFVHSPLGRFQMTASRQPKGKGPAAKRKVLRQARFIKPPDPDCRMPRTDTLNLFCKSGGYRYIGISSRVSAGISVLCRPLASMTACVAVR